MKIKVMIISFIVITCATLVFIFKNSYAMDNTVDNTVTTDSKINFILKN